MMMAVLTICIIVHILINIQKKVAFHKIEKSVSTHLDVNKENSKQVPEQHLVSNFSYNGAYTLV